jgi:hypothetical protein
MSAAYSMEASITRIPFLVLSATEDSEQLLRFAGSSFAICAQPLKRVEGHATRGKRRTVDEIKGNTAEIKLKAQN